MLVTILTSYRGKGVSVVLAGSISHFTEGVISDLSFIHGLGTVNVTVCFRRRGVGSLGRSDRACVNVCDIVTRSRDRGVDTGMG